MCWGRATARGAAKRVRARVARSALESWKDARLRRSLLRRRRAPPAKTLGYGESGFALGGRGELHGELQRRGADDAKAQPLVEKPSAIVLHHLEGEVLLLAPGALSHPAQEFRAKPAIARRRLQIEMAEIDVVARLADMEPARIDIAIDQHRGALVAERLLDAAPLVGLVPFHKLGGQRLHGVAVDRPAEGEILRADAAEFEIRHVAVPSMRCSRRPSRCRSHPCPRCSGVK